MNPSTAHVYAYGVGAVMKRFGEKAPLAIFPGAFLP
jgi:hypothetical protein